MPRAPGTLACRPLASLLQLVTGRTVVDKSGVTGLYDIELTYAPDRDLAANAGAEQNAASLYTALQEQLGLKLEAQKGPVDVLIIEHVEEPSPN